MKFWQAMKLLDEGYKVRRESWASGYIIKEDRDVVWYSKGRDDFSYNASGLSDMMAEDWVIYNQ